MALPKRAVAEDRRLEKAAESTSEALMRHRWHWTLDETNPERVAISDYARQIGKSRRLIQVYAKGYETLVGCEVGLAPGEALERAKMSAETEAAVDAVAEARGISFQHARQSRPHEVQRVRELGRELAEERGTTIEEETRKAAELTVKEEQANTALEADRRERHGLRFVEMEGKLEAVKQRLSEALYIAQALADEIKRLRGWARMVGDVRSSITAYATGGYSEHEALAEIDEIVNRDRSSR